MAATIEIIANGKPFTIPEAQPLTAFLKEIDLDPGMVVVERNRTALTPGEVRKTLLENGDRLEVVQITAGG